MTKDKEETGCPLGMDFIAQFNVLLDFPAQCLYLHRLTRTNPSLQSNHQELIYGMTIGVDKDAWQILSLEAGSRFDKAGLRAGDMIERINTTEVKGLLTEQVVAEFVKNKGVTLRVVRTLEGKNQNLTFVLP